MTSAALGLAGRLPGIPKLLARSFSFTHAALESRVAGLSFPNPVGLAAGFDKDCRLAHVLPALGFGFLELGTVTPRPQPGNERPRVFRFPEDEALVNRLGFPGEGAQAAGRRLAALRSRPVPIGLNLGINADVPAEQAPAEYAKVFSALYPYGDYFVVNVSSPNTRGLRQLQERIRLERILAALQGMNGDKKPVFVKLSPDLDPDALADILPLLKREAAGVVCANTTLSRQGMPEMMGATAGGLSGAPLRDLSTRMIRDVFRLTGGKLPIIGVGGISTPEDAYQKIRAGASLVQVYTGLVYRGPGLAGELNRGLARLLQEHRLSRIGEAVGMSHAPEKLERP